jgi:hypothetical protein
MPQLALQQNSPCAHVLLPHGVPVSGTHWPVESHRVPVGQGGLLGSLPQTLQPCCVHAPPCGAQMPQLALQQNSPRAHVVLPHGWPPPLSGTHCPAGSQIVPGGHVAPVELHPPPPQNCCVHAPPTGAQMPQLSLQQNSPRAQTLLPHVT